MRRETPGNRAAAAEGRLRSSNKPTPVEKTGTRKRAREGGPTRYSARVEYDGTDFAGFQVQPGARTVQGELERVLAQVSGGVPIRVEGAGRTDAGVHARGQVIGFTYAGRLERTELHGALAALLPADIGLRPLRRVGPAFRPRYRAVEREYRYFVWNGPRSPLRERYALGVRERLDVASMAAAGEVFVGRHDFSAFGGIDRQPVRTLHRVTVRRQGRTISVQVIGDAFLRQMVRRMVAALLRVGRGVASIEEVAEALADTRKPAFGGETAPAKGLVLWRVAMMYQDEEDDDENEHDEDKREDDEQDIQPASE